MYIMKILTKSYQSVFILCVISSFLGCSNFLDVKPDKSLSVPSTLADLKLLLENNIQLNSTYASSGEISSDNFFITENNWKALSSLTSRNLYVWNDDVFNDNRKNDWSSPYITVFSCNVILEKLKEITPAKNEIQVWNEIRGEALFFRAYAFYNLVSHFGRPYDSNTSKDDLGIVLRLNSTLQEKSERATIEESYEQIISDIKESLVFLPEKTLHVTHPTKSAALGLLARIYLDMGDFEKSSFYADECLTNNSNLLNFNTLDLQQFFPLARFNEEVIFWSSFDPIEIYGYARVSPELYGLFEDNDLRKTVYMKDAGDGFHVFSTDNYFFNGISFNEILLIKAECSARAGELSKAIYNLNYLLVNRYKTGTFVEYESSNQNEVLLKILEERRKELMFRGLRWTDLRRLNKDPLTSVDIIREVGEDRYVLKAGSSKYTLPIPNEVVEKTGVRQNEIL